MPAIEVEHLVKRSGDATVVDDVSFTVEDGEIFGILGPNGAGKTTIVETIEGNSPAGCRDDPRPRPRPDPGRGRGPPAARRSAPGEPAAGCPTS